MWQIILYDIVWFKKKKKKSHLDSVLVTQHKCMKSAYAKICHLSWCLVGQNIFKKQTYHEIYCYLDISFFCLFFIYTHITILSSPSTVSPSFSMISYTTPRTLLTTSGSSAELSAVAGAMISGVMNWSCWVMPDCRMVSRAVQCDKGERTAEHTRPLSFTSESWRNKHKKKQEKSGVHREIPTEDTEYRRKFPNRMLLTQVSCMLELKPVSGGSDWIRCHDKNGLSIHFSGCCAFLHRQFTTQGLPQKKTHRRAGQKLSQIFGKKRSPKSQTAWNFSEAETNQVDSRLNSLRERESVLVET